uniref:Direct IAP-binding protein with low pI n=2 Tax=Scleropages formosus TaxID=113540 RepID=A0A8C9QZ59_SCLFO
MQCAWRCGSAAPHFLLVHSNMGAFRRGFAALGLLRWSAVLAGSSRRSPSARHRLADLPLAAGRSWISVCVGGLCAVPFSQQTEGLTYETLIRRASSLVTDSTNTFLSQTTLALVDSIAEYIKAMHTLMALQQRYMTSVGKLNPAEEDSVWQVIIHQREQVKDRRDEYKRLESNWMNAIHLSELAAEAAYNAGADHASVTAQTNLQVAQAQVEQVRLQLLETEKKMAETKAEEMQRMAQFASRNVEEEEEDIPEAYLRED